jgi:hypothetical protein
VEWRLVFGIGPKVALSDSSTKVKELDLRRSKKLGAKKVSLAKS